MLLEGRPELCQLSFRRVPAVELIFADELQVFVLPSLYIPCGEFEHRPTPPQDPVSRGRRPRSSWEGQAFRGPAGLGLRWGLLTGTFVKAQASAPVPQFPRPVPGEGYTKPGLPGTKASGFRAVSKQRKEQNLVSPTSSAPMGPPPFLLH